MTEAQKMAEANLIVRREETAAMRSQAKTISLEAESESVTEVFTGFGTKGVMAHKVPIPAIKDCRLYLASSAVVGKRLADQLMIPIAMAGGGQYRTVPLTLHSRTNIDVIKQFMDIHIAVTEVGDCTIDVSIQR
ncbi:RNA 3'-terminal phosphate cyclase [Planctomycetota bacterium]